MDFLYGTLTGVLSSILFWGLTSLIKGAFIPWYEKLSYKGIFIDDKWQGGYSAENTHYQIKAVLDLSQKGDCLSGIFTAETLYPANPESNYSNQYRLNGKMKNYLVLLNYEALSEQRTGAGVALFRISKGGNNLVGNIIHSEDTNQLWHITPFTLKRTN